jgi:hypothetical protein
VKNELEMILKEGAVAEVKVLSRHLPGATEENHEIPQDSGFPGHDLKPGRPKYEAEMLATRHTLKGIREIACEVRRWVELAQGIFSGGR